MLKVPQAAITAGATLLSMVISAGAMSASAMAQAPTAGPKKYRSFYDADLIRFVDKTLDQDRSERNKRRFLVAGICKGSKPLNNTELDNRPLFDAYFMKYYFPRMTHPDELGNIAEMRMDLMKQYFGVIKNDSNGQEVRDRINALTLKFMQGIVGTKLGEFHPAVRYNAMLIIGDLDSRGPELFGNARPAEPLIAALDIMRGELVSKDQIDAVRVAALIGIARHAELDRHRPANRRIPDAALRPLIEPLVTIATTSEPPASRSAEGHTWMRRQALEALASFASTRPIGPVATAVDSIISDPTAPLALRCAAAESQGKMQNPLAEGVTAEQAAMKLTRLAGDILEAELEGLEPYLDELKIKEESAIDTGLSGGRATITDGGLGILGGEAAGSTDDAVIETSPQVAAVQRRGKHLLRCVQNGLSGVDGGRGVVAGVQDAAARSKASQVQTLLNQTDKMRTDDAPIGTKPAFAEVDAYYGSLDAQLKSFNEIAPKPKTAEPPADAGTGPDSTTQPPPLPDGPPPLPSGPPPLPPQ